MPKPLPVQTNPVTIYLPDGGTQLITTYNETKEVHEVVCDICSSTIRLTKTGHPANFLAHRRSQNCTKSKKNLPVNQSQTNPNPRPKIPQPVPCQGVSVEWKDFLETYPYHLHVSPLVDLDWIPIGFLHDEEKIIFRAIKCTGTGFVSSTQSIVPCPACWRVPYSADFKRFADRVIECKESTAWDFLNSVQHRTLLDKMRREMKSLRTKLDTAEGTIQILQEKISEYLEILTLLGSKDIASLRKLLNHALSNGYGTRGIMFLLQRAVDGNFLPRGDFTDTELDIAYISLILGGPRLLYALKRVYNLPCAQTLRDKCYIPRLLASLGEPTAEELDSNMRSILDPDTRPPPEKTADGRLPGICLMVDGVSTELRLRYCQRRDAVIGLCREHSSNLGTNKVIDMAFIEKLRKALYDPESTASESKVCIGGEATVIAIAPIARVGEKMEHYQAIPLALSPSCKTEKGPELASWTRKLIDIYAEHPLGAKTTGPIWSWATDGDSSYRSAKHRLCMAVEIDPSSPLGKILHQLCGMNLYTSHDGIVGTCDPKHVFKRFATLLRNLLGIVIDDTVITPEDIIRFLALLHDMTLEKALNLLDPADKQNVPKAVTLIQLLNKLKDLPSSTDPFQKRRREKLSFFAEVLGYFLFPFIKVDMTLSEQIRMLSAYAHLVTALYTWHGTACFTGPIFYDSQSIVKCIVITVARLQLQDPELRYHIFFEGTDRLENLFCDCRTQDHARNFDVDQLSSKLSNATLINAVFERNASWSRGHRRLNLRGAMGIDRINPESWEGDTRVGNIDLAEEWKHGEFIANNLLAKYFGDGQRFDFSSHFQKPDHDILRPNGDYVGLQTDKNDKKTEEAIAEEIASPNIATMPPTREDTTTQTSAAPHTGIREEVEEQEDEDEQLPPSDSALEFSDMPGSGSDMDEQYREENEPSVLHSIEGMLLDQYGAEEDEADNANDSGLTIDDMFPDTVNNDTVDDAGNDTTTETLSRFLEVDGKKFLKSSLITALSSNRAKKVVLRTLRVQGITLEDLYKSRFSNALDPILTDDSQLLKSGSIAGCFVWSNSALCFAIIEITGFRDPQQNITRKTASLDDITSPTSRLLVFGQVMDIAERSSTWRWKNEYLKIRTEKTDEQTKTGHKDILLDVPSLFIIPLNPPQLDPLAAVNGEIHDPVWELKTSEIEKKVDELFTKMKDLRNLELQKIPKMENLPYRDANGYAKFVIKDIPSSFQLRKKLHARTKIKCCLCNAVHPVSKMRHHVAFHILHSNRGTLDSTLICPVGLNPCGFCGGDDCDTVIRIKRTGSVEITSSCEYYTKINFDETITEETPSTNVPIECLLCKAANPERSCTIWKYNAINHLILEHTEVRNNRSSTLPIPRKMTREIYISKKEEEKLGVELCRTLEARERLFLPGSDDIEHEKIEEEAERKRVRSDTVASNGRPGKKRR